MARSTLRAPGPTDPEPALRLHPPAFLAAGLLLAPLLGCVSYEPAPVDPAALLRALDELRWQPPSSPEAEGAATPGELAAFAIAHNPTLAGVRRRIGIAGALLVEAGLLADPEISWDGMDALAAETSGGSASRVEFLSGLGLAIALPRPGELDARKGVARWQVEVVRRRVAQAEWTLAREVHVACEDLLEANRLLEQNAELVRVAEGTRDYFERAKEAGAATAIQANLAAGELLAIRASRVRLEARLRAARQRLNALLGLPPQTEIPVRPPEVQPTLSEGDADDLAERAVATRPDLSVLMATYAAAEEEVRLEVARQFPLIVVGTGIAFVPGFFTRFNRPAIATALARREALRQEIEAAVHEVRRDVHDAFAELAEIARETEFLETELLPNAEESLRLAGEAFDAGEVTLLEILTLQRALVDARTRTTEARAEFQRRRWRLRAAAGTLLAPDDTDDTNPIR